MSGLWKIDLENERKAVMANDVFKSAKRPSGTSNIKASTQGFSTRLMLLKTARREGEYRHRPLMCADEIR